MSSVHEALHAIGVELQYRKQMFAKYILTTQYPGMNLQPIPIPVSKRIKWSHLAPSVNQSCNIDEDRKVGDVVICMNETGDFICKDKNGTELTEKERERISRV